MQVFRWASKYANVHIVDGTTDYEKRHSLLLDAQGMKVNEIYEEYGVGKAAHNRRQKLLSKTLGYKNIKKIVLHSCPNVYL